MIFHDEIKKLTKRELVEIIDFIDYSLNISQEEGSFCELINRIKAFIPHDFAICCYVEVKEKALSRVKEIVNVSYPKEWMKIYFKNNYQAIDLILRTHFSTFRPQIWSKTYQRYSDNINLNFLSKAQDFGLSEGLTYGIFEPEDSTGTIISFSGSSIKPSNQQVACMKIIVPYIHQTLIRVSRKKMILKETGISLPLSAREIEVLKWVKLGKTNWEISAILNISERTAKFHVLNIIRKLNASTRGHAVAKALELEIITL
jgi:DNA-binding CsgD family transcriptional regulator